MAIGRLLRTPSKAFKQACNTAQTVMSIAGTGSKQGSFPMCKMSCNFGPACMYAFRGHLLGESEPVPRGQGRFWINGITCTMDATRCIIVHLAATQSLQHTICDDSIPLWYYGVVVGVIAVILVQVCLLAGSASWRPSLH